MKKFLSITLALVLMMSLSLTAFAANQTSGQTDLSFTHAGPAAPTYTVTIPASLDLKIGDNPVDITVSDMQNMNGKSVVVTFEGTQRYVPPREMYDLVLSANDGRNLYYFLIDEAGKESPNEAPKGITLVTFSSNSTRSYTILFDPEGRNGDDFREIPPGVFTGYITYGIKVQ
jgi:hypothetical protein